MKDHHIYVITVAKPGEDRGPVKIGITGNVDARFCALQTASPYPLQLVHVFTAPDAQCARGVERAFHEIQAKHRTHGEWFDLSPVVAVQIMCLNLEVMFKFRCKFTADEIEVAREMSGVAAAFEKMPEFA